MGTRAATVTTTTHLTPCQPSRVDTDASSHLVADGLNDSRTGRVLDEGNAIPVDVFYVEVEPAPRLLHEALGEIHASTSILREEFLHVRHFD
jgi:hypothetical protein